MLALCGRLALFRSQGDGCAHRSMKLTRYRIHRTGRMRRSSFRRRRLSAARSNGGSMVEEACDAGACWTNAPFSAALESAIAIAHNNGECNLSRGILIVGKKKSRLHWTPCNGVDISLAAYGHGDFLPAALQAHRSKAVCYIAGGPDTCIDFLFRCDAEAHIPSLTTQNRRHIAQVFSLKLD